MYSGTEIDLKKPYGTVIGEPPIKYVQNGKFYGQNGKLIETKTTETIPVDKIKK